VLFQPRGEQPLTFPLRGARGKFKHRLKFAEPGEPSCLVPDTSIG
jgi:hypothetical protein